MAGGGTFSAGSIGIGASKLGKTPLGLKIARGMAPEFNSDATISVKVEFAEPAHVKGQDGIEARERLLGAARKRDRPTM